MNSSIEQIVSLYLSWSTTLQTLLLYVLSLSTMASNAIEVEDDIVDSSFTNDHTTNGYTVEADVLNGTDNFKPDFTPIAICGMACKLPGEVKSASQLWDFLVS